MFSLLLAVANPAVENTHAAEGGLVHDLVEKFGIDGVNVSMQLVSFAILAFVLYWFAIKPILASADERNKQLEEGLKNAAATGAKLAEAQAQAAALLKQAQVDASKVIDEARKTAKELSDREIAAATERASGLIAKAQQAIELEHKKMLLEARGEIARLVVATTRSVLAKELSDADRSRYNEAAARELTTA